MGRSTLAAGAIALLLIATACGDDGGGSGSSGDDAEYVDAIAAAMTAEMSEQDLALFGEDGARCTAAAIVDAIGVDGLIALGLDLDAIENGDQLDESDLSAEQVEPLADGVLDCIDLGAAFAAESEGAISDDAANCLGDRMKSSETFRDVFVQGLLGGDSVDPFAAADSSAQAEIIEMVTDCLTPEELAQLGSG